MRLNPFARPTAGACRSAIEHHVPEAIAFRDLDNHLLVFGNGRPVDVPHNLKGTSGLRRKGFGKPAKLHAKLGSGFFVFRIMP